MNLQWPLSTQRSRESICTDTELVTHLQYLLNLVILGTGLTLIQFTPTVVTYV